jgi:hypothetical protein
MDGAAREAFLDSTTTPGRRRQETVSNEEETEVSTELGSLPPASRIRDERPEWAELIRLRAHAEVCRLVDRLALAGIESRLRLSSVRRRGKPLRAVLVPRPELEDARFVVVQIAYESPSVGERRRGLEPIFRWATVGLTGIVLSASLLASPAHLAPVPERCPTGAMAAAGSCP